MIIQDAIEVLKIEADAILKLIDRIDGNFTKMVEMIYNSDGRVIIGGIGKSGIIGQKIVATLNSTGSRSIFLHPVEAMHGDLGIVCKNDIFLALSNSGETDEINILVPAIKEIGCPVIAFTGNIESSLAKSSDIVIDVSVDKEACPLGLAPTASTTAVLAMGDALAVALINKKKFKSSDFKKIHPGGLLGQRLSSKVTEIMLPEDSVPWVSNNSSFQEAIEIMNRFELGVTLILDSEKNLKGIITDGDIRRLVAEKKVLDSLSTEDVMTKGPLTVASNMPVYDALNIMEQHQITVLPVINKRGQVKGIIHLHDILGKGAFKFNG
ncbi:MAG: KpsF/GutQ family sugar-phosphate isomerase [Desulfobacterales bacterium]|jgi:arabinose-5-phosphate isomerase|nr:KpsF/GutQ family sugar-phosphate isomerase [Desulfobacteraceae bacterium]MBT4364239.1 KpsF/GutQ family sugar-phosphate isomerase [Desulfobacteraceae bacterium]MBT7085414.1 KpsF/GutQ family sugar-phosphate isomerase [Desulfobacterales bacterium]MBT7695808.1 KpsF/GutQ family sugar-phosphate isomerase [Desulfobacterales bacterium]